MPIFYYEKIDGFQRARSVWYGSTKFRLSQFSQIKASYFCNCWEAQLIPYSLKGEFKCIPKCITLEFPGTVNNTKLDFDRYIYVKSAQKCIVGMLSTCSAPQAPSLFPNYDLNWAPNYILGGSQWRGFHIGTGFAFYIREKKAASSFLLLVEKN